MSTKSNGPLQTPGAPAGPVGTRPTLTYQEAMAAINGHPVLATHRPDFRLVSHGNYGPGRHSVLVKRDAVLRLTEVHRTPQFQSGRYGGAKVTWEFEGEGTALRSWHDVLMRLGARIVEGGHDANGAAITQATAASPTSDAA